MKNLLYLILISAFFTVSLISCQKEKNEADINKEFCASVSAHDFDKTETLINNFLKTVNPGLPDSEKMDKVSAWFQNKSCVSDAKVLCVSCIDTNPAQSEIAITFNINGQPIDKVLDVIMANPMRCHFHE